jgi:hypothetical protein
MRSTVRSWFGRHYMGVVALFVALSGTAYAASTVNSGDVVNNSLKSKDLKDNAAVKSQDVVDESLTSVDIAPNSIAGVDVNENALDVLPLANPADPNTYSTAAASVLYMNTADPAQSYPASGTLGEGLHFETTGTVDQFKVCNDASYNDVDVVVESAGVRSVLNLDSEECSTAQTIQDDEEFTVFGLGTVTFGAYAGNTTPASEADVYVLFTFADFDFNN